MSAVISDNATVTLPEAVLLEVFKYLDYVALIKASKVCIYWNSVALSDSIWKALSKYYWLVDEHPENCKNWKDVFKSHYIKYRCYINCFRQVKGSWNKLEKWLREHCPDCYHSLNEGVDENVLQKFESEECFSIPNDLKLSYLIHNGQQSNGYCGLFGGQCVMLHENMKYVFSNFMLSFEEAVQVSVPGDTAVLQLSQSGNSPQELYDYYQILNPPSHAIERETKIVACYTKDPAEIVFGISKAYDIGDSYTQWFSNYVDKLTSGQYLVEDGKILAYDAATEVVAVTQNITVSVRWAPIPSGFSDQHAFSYYITMEMDKTAPAKLSCKLVGRHWEIKDDDGNVQTVKGSGVVGHYPVMTPGAKFAWQSWTAFDNGGSMVGYFIMHRLQEVDYQVNIQCPEFKMYNQWKYYNGL